MVKKVYNWGYCPGQKEIKDGKRHQCWRPFMHDGLCKGGIEGSAISWDEFMEEHEFEPENDTTVLPVELREEYTRQELLEDKPVIPLRDLWKSK